MRVIFTDKNNDGLIRQSLDDNLNEVLSFRNHSPFGLELGGSHKNLDYQNGYKFGGKEHNNFTNYIDFGRRNFDAPLGRFTSQDRFSEKYYGLNTMGYAAVNPINIIDINGDSLDLSKLTSTQRELFNEQIQMLSSSKLFSAYYSALKSSKTIYTISFQNGKAGTVTEAGQFFNTATKEVGVGSGKNSNIVAQELFHAFQNETGLYKNDKPSPLSTIETEGDIVTIYVMNESNLGFPNYGSWSEKFMLDAYDGTPKTEKVQSKEYQEMFQDAVNNRIKYYKSIGINAETYTSPNTGSKPKVWEYLIKMISIK